MSWVFDDPWDDYKNLQQRWDVIASAGGGALPVITQGAGRRGSAALEIGSSFINGAGNSYVQKNVPYQDTYISNFALRVPAGQPANIDTILCGFVDGETPQIVLALAPDGHLRARRNETILGSSTVSMPFGEDHYIEIKAKVHPSAGTITVRLDEVEVLALTGLNTSQSGAARIGAFQFGGSYGGAARTTLRCYFDDFILLDTLGSQNNDFIGDHYLGVLLTDGAGDATDFGLAGADTNWQAVRDMPEVHNAGEFNTWTMAADSSSQYGSGITRVPAFLLDGDPNTFWRSGTGALPHWVTIDLGAAKTVDLIKLWLYSAAIWDEGPRTIELYVSDDGASWGSVVDTLDNIPSPVNESEIYWRLAAPQTHRYLKLNVTAVQTGTIVRLAGVSAAATYVSSDTPGEKDLYNYQDVDPAVGAIAFASVWPYAHKEDGGSRGIRVLAKSGAVEADNGADMPVSTNPAYLPAAFEVDPDTLAPWTIAGVNAAQFGVKIAGA